MQPGIGPTYYEPVYKQGNSIGDKLYNAVEDYFYLDGLSTGRKFTVINTKRNGEVDVKLEARTIPTFTGWALTALKLLSWVTIVVPASMWLAHKLHTPSNKSQFKVIDPSTLPNFPRPTPQKTPPSTAPDPSLTRAEPHPKPQSPARFQPGKQSFVELTGTEEPKALTNRLKQEGPGTCVIKESRTFLGDYSVEGANFPKTRLLAKEGEGFYYYGTQNRSPTLTTLLDSLQISKVLAPKGLKEKLEACNELPATIVISGVKIDTASVTSKTSHDEAMKALDRVKNGCLIEKANLIEGRPLYRFTYNNGKERVSHIVEIITEKNRQEGQIPGHLQFYTIDAEKKLTPLGETYTNLKTFLLRFKIISKGESSCLIAPEVLDELRRKAPVLKSTKHDDINDFIIDFLEPFIKCEISPEEAKGRRPMVDVLTEQYKALFAGKTLTEGEKAELDYLPRMAHIQYTRILVKGLYEMLADQKADFDPRKNVEANSAEFREFFGAYCDAVRFDFKGVSFSDEVLWAAATGALKKINELRTEVQSRGKQVQG